MEICTVGGYNEVGKNMTAVKVGDEVVIFDMGIYLPPIVNLEEEEKLNLSTIKLRKIGALPDDTVLDQLGWTKKVKAICLGHVHLDHIEAVPYLAAKYNCPIYASPYTMEVLKVIIAEEDAILPNDLRTINLNTTMKISDSLKIEFINITHSTPQSAMMCLHTKEGIVLYCNDFKFDNNPIIGDAPNYARLKELRYQNVAAMIVESLYADREGKTPSEKVARELLKDVMLGVSNEKNAIFVTTFASHIARISSAVEFAEQLKRKVVFLGRSMGKYIKAAENVSIVNFSKKGEIVSYKRDIKKVLSKIEKNRDEYVVICTGNQGEPGSTLDKMVKKQLQFNFKDGDSVIFASKVIPDPVNIANRKVLESKLKKARVRIFTDIHSSGHSSREDLRDLITMVKPKNIIPAHGDGAKLNALAELAKECGYSQGKNLYLMYNGKKIKI
ncbi:MAG: RNase J family beta-CASP ribonuclease [Candidatus Nanoarchaeia archaeon]|nr:RNase J family beta-CASP ribonuclease [Candidatus Nanoarchaeia archaeon]MDD5588354.1 RNase J family beta-CASP ribonuclease [Candidatus Nanoarchaeia archaeon]